MGLVENKLPHRVNCTHLTLYLVEVNFLSAFHCERKKSLVGNKHTKREQKLITSCRFPTSKINEISHYYLSSVI